MFEHDVAPQYQGGGSVPHGKDGQLYPPAGGRFGHHDGLDPGGIVGEGPGDGLGHRRGRHQAGRFGFAGAPSVAGKHPPFAIHEHRRAGETRQQIARIEKHAEGGF